MFRRFIPTPGRARRLTVLAAALLLSALTAIPASGLALAQSPPPDTDNITLVNWDRQMVERKKEGDFVARPVFSRPTDVLFYSIRHPDTGEWITSTYRVQGGEKKLSEGWEYTFEYPALDEQPELHPEQAFLLVLAVPRTGRRRPPRLPRPDSRPPTQGVVGQGAGRPGPGPLGQGRRPVGDPGSPRDSLRGGGGSDPDPSRRMRGGVAAYGRHPHRHPSESHL